MKMRSPDAWLAVLLIMGIWGCSSASTSNGLCQVKGKVDLNGQPVEEGFITFKDPAKVQRSFGGPIRNGQFSVAVEPGLKRVEVTAQRPIPGQSMPGPSGGTVPATESYIPEKYNQKSELTVDVTGTKQNDVHLKLVSE